MLVLCSIQSRAGVEVRFHQPVIDNQKMWPVCQSPWSSGVCNPVYYIRIQTERVKVLISFIGPVSGYKFQHANFQGRCWRFVLTFLMQFLGGWLLY